MEGILCMLNSISCKNPKQFVGLGQVNKLIYGVGGANSYRDNI